MKNIFKNLFYLLLPIVIGIIVGLLINNQIDYNTLVKPRFAPPSILFPIIWSIIYILMGISYYLLNKDNFISKDVKIIYYLQLGFNALWSIIFFVLKLRLLACIWIIILDILVTLMISKFFDIKKICAYLNIPYLIWCLFATYLTIGIYILNR